MMIQKSPLSGVRQAKENMNLWATRLAEELKSLPAAESPEIRQLEDKLCSTVGQSDQAASLGSIKAAVRQNLGQLRETIGDDQAPQPLKRAYEKLRNLALDDDLKREMNGYSSQHYTIAPSASDIPNFQEINPNFVRGGQATQEGLFWLGMQGVKTEIDLRDEDRQNQWDLPAKNPLNSVNLPIADFGSPGFDKVEQFINIVDAPENQPVYVHCKAGVGRTGLMTACWRVAHGATADEALAMESINSSYGSLKQEQFVHEFETYWQNKGNNPSTLVAF